MTHMVRTQTGTMTAMAMRAERLRPSSLGGTATVSEELTPEGKPEPQLAGHMEQTLFVQIQSLSQSLKETHGSPRQWPAQKHLGCAPVACGDLSMDEDSVTTETMLVATSDVAAGNKIDGIEVAVRTRKEERMEVAGTEVAVMVAMVVLVYQRLGCTLDRILTRVWEESRDDMRV